MRLPCRNLQQPKAWKRQRAAVVNSAFQVHSTLGPGLLESAYEDCLCHELALRRIQHERQRIVPIFYKGKRIEAGFRADLIVESDLIVELKAVDKLLPIHSAQLFTYLKLANKRLGLLINFNVPLIKDGIRRIVC